MSIIDQDVRNEADAKELREILVEMTDGDVGEGAIYSVLENLPRAVALWLLKSQPLPDGSRRGEQRRGFIFHLTRVPEAEGHGVAAGHKVEEHYRLDIKAERGFLQELEDVFKLPVKN